MRRAPVARGIDSSWLVPTVRVCRLSKFARVFDVSTNPFTSRNNRFQRENCPVSGSMQVGLLQMASNSCRLDKSPIQEGSSLFAKLFALVADEHKATAESAETQTAQLCEAAPTPQTNETKSNIAAHSKNVFRLLYVPKPKPTRTHLPNPPWPPAKNPPISSHTIPSHPHEKHNHSHHPLYGLCRTKWKLFALALTRTSH